MKKLFTILAMTVTTMVTAQTYHLQSNVDIVVNKPNDIIGKDTTRLMGKVKGVYWSNSFNKVQVEYQYLKQDSTLVKESVYVVEGAEIQALYELVKDGIPTGLDKRASEMYMFVSAMRLLMAQTFGISPTDISIITE